MRTLIPALLSLAVAVCAATQAHAETSALENIQSAKKIVIMNNLSAAPWQFIDAKGDAAGFSIDLDRMIAAKLDVDLVLKNVDWAGLIPGLRTHKSDILATTMSVTPRRAKQVLFTKESWYRTGVVAIVRPDDADESWEDLNKAGKTIAVKTGTTAVDVGREHFGNAELQSYPGDTDTYQALKTKRVDAALVDLAVVELVHHDYGFAPLKKPRELISNDRFAFCVRPGDVATQKFLDSFLTEIKANGQMDALRTYWLNGDTWKKDFLGKNGGVSDERKELAKKLGISAYLPTAGSNSRMSLK